MQFNDDGVELSSAGKNKIESKAAKLKSKCHDTNICLVVKQPVGTQTTPTVTERSQQY